MLAVLVLGSWSQQQQALTILRYLYIDIYSSLNDMLEGTGRVIFHTFLIHSCVSTLYNVKEADG